jgi:hypothetical protein
MSAHPSGQGRCTTQHGGANSKGAIAKGLLTTTRNRPAPSHATSRLTANCAILNYGWTIFRAHPAELACTLWRPHSVPNPTPANHSQEAPHLLCSTPRSQSRDATVAAATMQSRASFRDIAFTTSSPSSLSTMETSLSRAKEDDLIVTAHVRTGTSAPHAIVRETLDACECLYRARNKRSQQE